MLQVVLFLILTAFVSISFAVILLLGVWRLVAVLRKKTNGKQILRLKKAAVFFAIVMILNIALIIVSQFTATTPPIVDDNGMIPENSITELTEVNLNGRKQWISMRGWDTKKPVLLFLAGGPGVPKWQLFGMNFPSLRNILL